MATTMCFINTTAERTLDVFRQFTLMQYQQNMGLNARKPVFGVCEQHRCRPACASAQADQRLCYSLFEKYHI